jgi:oligoendopeptidase F
MKLKTGEWDLSALVKSPNSEEINDRLVRINSLISSFEENKNLLNSNITSNDFVKLIHDSEIIAEDLSIITSYAYLKYAENTSSNSNAGLVTKMSNFFNGSSEQIAIF